MTRHTPPARLDAALHDLVPEARSTLTAEERRRAEVMLTRILTSPGQEHVGTESRPPRRRRALLLVPAGLLAVAALAPTVLSSDSAFASWSPTPAPLDPSTAAAAATTCRAAMDIVDPRSQVVVGERRGGWTYVRLAGPRGEGACLMPDGLVGSRDVPRRRSGLFGSYDLETLEPPTLARDGIDETESMSGTVTLPGRVWLGTVEGSMTWTDGYVGRDVTGVTVHPAVGPAVQASLSEGRFSAWWPDGETRPGAGGPWTYTVTLADGTTRRVRAG